MGFTRLGTVRVNPLITIGKYQARPKGGGGGGAVGAIAPPFWKFFFFFACMLVIEVGDV